MYIDLVPCRREIRLLRLLPGLPFTKIRCSLSTVSLDNPPPYQALSYVWGDANIKKSIELDKLDFQITTNLHAALRHLRWPNRARNLWIDAICINQDSVSEKNHQVPLMGSIYKSGDEVIIWLGEASEDSRTALDLINRLSKCPGDGLVWESEDRGSADASTSYVREINTTTGDAELILGELENDLLDERSVTSFVNLLNRSWWNRTWVVQEIALAKKAQILCGNRLISWDDLERAFVKVALYGSRSHQISKLLRNHIKAPQILGLMKFPHLQDNAPQKAPLLSLLSQHAARAVTDERDKIYSMLSLTTDPQHTLPIPDYRRPFHQVYRETALSFIKHSRNLDVLNQVWDPKQESTLPSWVPNWNKAYGPHPLLETPEKGRAFHASMNTSPKIRDGEDPNILTLTGILIDDICKMSMPADLETNFNKSYQDWEAFARVDDLVRPYIGGGDICNAFWRTLTASKFLGSTAENTNSPHALQAPDSGRMAYLVFSKRAKVPEEFMKNHLSEEERYNGYIVNFWPRLINSVKNRRLFTTSEGYLGTGPTHLKPGDQVCILLGGTTPFVARPNGKGYSLIGECYVHGLMNGEIIRGLRSGETRLLELSFQ